jgi:AcrR family transcriptional regulator
MFVVTLTPYAAVRGVHGELWIAPRATGAATNPRTHNPTETARARRFPPATTVSLPLKRLERRLSNCANYRKEREQASRGGTMTVRTGRPPRSRAPVGLERDRIITAALELMDNHGVRWLTMRRLAAELGVTPAAVYWHIGSKDELWAAVVDHAMSTLSIDSDPAQGWQARVRLFMTQVRASLLAHPCVPELTLRVAPGPAHHHMTNEALDIMRAAGFPTGARSHYASIMIWQAYSYPIIEMGLRRARYVERGEDVDGAARLVLHARDYGEPNSDIAAMRDVSLDAQFSTTIDLLVAGFSDALGERSEH